ncbi:ATP-binding protein [Candidatus Shapirobacteria bacterium]|nr:ATP-binding protein [Candidatus Shapirobacteria bacterium]
MYRYLEEKIKWTLDKSGWQPIVLLLGLRQTGKSTLARNVCGQIKYRLFNFDLQTDRLEFMDNNRHTLEEFARRYENEIIIVDEVQKLPESTGTIKHLYDNFHLKFIMTGSSEVAIKKNISDSMAGRVKIFHLYPLNIKEELVQKEKISETDKVGFDDGMIEIQNYLTYGSLPKMLNLKQEEREGYLKDLTNLILSKDMLDVIEVKSSIKVLTLAKFLAMQIGQLVSVGELAMLTELSRPTVYNYLDIFEQMNLICRAYPLSTNNREAISSKFKVYFTDLGLRNALVNDFRALNQRLDSGLLLENAVYMGIKRNNDYEEKVVEQGFFRSERGVEMDIVLKGSDMEKVYEVKKSDKVRKKDGVEYITMKNAGEFLV